MRRSKAKSIKLTVVKQDNLLKDTEIATLKAQQAALLQAQLRQRAADDLHYDFLLQRLASGEAHRVELLDELRAKTDRAQADADASAEAQRAVEQQLAGSKAALDTFAHFQAKEGGKYKDAVRTCYYSLINRKIPTNQIEGTVRDVLAMVGVDVANLPTRASAQNMRREAGFIGDVVAGVELAAARYVCGASDDTTKRQKLLAGDLTHHIDADGNMRTLCIDLSAISAATTKDKSAHYNARLQAVGAAARLAVPDFHGDVAAFDRVSLLELITCWQSDRAIVERNMAKHLEGMKSEQARAKTGAEQYELLRATPERASVGVSGLESLGGRVRLTLSVVKNSEKLVELQRVARTDVAERLDLSTKTAEEKEEVMHAECVRVLGAAWWLTLSNGERDRIARVNAFTCNAHRMVNVGKYWQRVR